MATLHFSHYAISIIKTICEYNREFACLSNRIDLTLRRKTAEKLGKINLLVFSGELVKDSFAQVDAVVVGDSVKEKEFAKIISSLEKSLGRELRYSIFSNKEFTYRFQMHDAFVRDILNRPKKILINNNDFLSQFSEEKNITPKEESLGN